MHCLYCDRPLALLKRLTGDGEFCSKEHRRIYQQEHNQLALARLLESQPKAKEKPRPKSQDFSPEPEIVEPVVKAPERPQPTLAGFMSESLDAGSVPGAKRLVSAPLFMPGKPVWGGIDAAASFQKRFKTAGFLAETARPRFGTGAVRFQNKLGFKRPVGKLLLEEKLSRAGEAVRHPQPAGAGFVFEQPARRLSFGRPRPPAGARFKALTPVKEWAGALRSIRDSKLRIARFFASMAIARTAPGRIRLPAIETRWKPLSPALPTRTPGKIILVLGSLLQRPVRPATQDLPPEIFEIPFEPMSYPQYSPRMGCLEERLHRTDRIGFSPP